MKLLTGYGKGFYKQTTCSKVNQVEYCYKTDSIVNTMNNNAHNRIFTCRIIKSRFYKVKKLYMF
jgi:hypothetical protein